jgi:alpha-1,3-rhamnosyltransferase
MRPSVSVWLPSYNHAPYLPAAVESVLAQTLRDWELILVEDGSSDGSLQIARGYAAAHPGRVTVLTHPGHANRGVSESASVGIARARGRFLLGLASDDALFPDALERAARYLDRRPAVGFVYGYAQVVDDDGRRLPDVRAFGVDLTRGGRTIDRLVEGNQIPSMTAMFRRECLDDIGPHDGKLVYSDWEIFVRAAARWDVGFLPRPLAMYRVHGANTGIGIDLQTNLERALEVNSALRERAAQIGGRLADPGVLALLDLQHAFLLFAAGNAAAAADPLRSAFARNPSLENDPRPLGDWLRRRLLDPLLPAGCVAEFERWLLATCAPVLGPHGVRVLQTDAAAATAERRAVRLAQAGHRRGAGRAAVAVVRHRPRRLADRRIAALMLDSVAGGLPARLLRTAKRRVFGYR